MKFVHGVGASLVTVACALATAVLPPSAEASSKANPTADLRVALQHIVSSDEGPPAAVALVQHGPSTTVLSAGATDFGNLGQAPTADDHVRVASVSKAFGGAAALALVAKHSLTLHDTIGKWLPGFPDAWRSVTLGELLQHTSGIPDFSQCRGFQVAVGASPMSPEPPRQLVAYAERPPCYDPKRPLHFTPGTKYQYSNSDNVIVGLMIQAATNQDYGTVLSQTVSQPLGLSQTTLPSAATMPLPYVHGYLFDPAEGPVDVTEDLAAGWSWASGGVVSTPADANRFVRGYVRGATTDAATHAKQFQFVPGESEPPGPGTNAAGMAIFRYRTECGTVYGHTGNTLGYTQFVAASGNGENSVSISVSSQISPKVNAALFPQLRRIFELGVCAAMQG